MRPFRKSIYYENIRCQTEENADEKKLEKGIEKKDTKINYDDKETELLQLFENNNETLTRNFTESLNSTESIESLNHSSSSDETTKPSEAVNENETLTSNRLTKISKNKRTFRCQRLERRRKA